MTAPIWRYLQRCKHAVTAMVLTLWVAAPVWGDDTEIFFGNFQGGAFLPNVLFIMDTSGSMRSRPNDSNNEAKINIVKEALRQLAYEMSGVNVGLMRFSNPGGPVLYPVTYIDQEIPSFGTGAETTVTAVASSQSDATQNLSTGLVDVAGESSTIGTGEDVTIIEAYVNEDDEDAEESRSGDFTTGGNFFDFRGVGDKAGIRFWEIDVPRGAAVTDARLTMTVSNNSDGNRGSLTTRVCGDLVPAQDFRDYSDRPSQREKTANCVDWAMDTAAGGVPALNSTVESPNLGSIIDEIVGANNWRDGFWANNDIVLLLEQTDASDDNAQRQFRTYDNSSDASKLTIRYSEGGGIADTVSGLVFNGVSVPKGATITSAYLELTPRNTVQGTPALNVALESGSFAQPFAGGANEISNRIAASQLSADVTAPSWVDGATAQLDISALVQTAVNDANWCGGESLGFLLSRTGERLDFESYDGDPNLAPLVRVTYDADSVVPGDTCVETSQTKRVGSSNDDIEFRSTSGGNYASSRSYMYINDDEWIAMRFANYTLPSDAEITSAYLHLVADRDDTTTDVSLALSIEDTADSQPLPGTNPGTARTWSGNVPWSINENWRSGISYRSPDISSLIQTVLTAGFTSGNAITLRADLAAGDRLIWETYDDNPIVAPMLEINFKSTGEDAFNTARTEFISAVDSLSAEGFTPIQDTLFEGFQYYAGNPVVWGKYRGGHDANGNRINVANESADAEPFWYTRVSVEDAITPESWGGVRRPPGCTEDNLSSVACDDANGANEPEGEYLLGNPIYKSPIENQCQFESHIVFLTDGAANEPHSEALIKSAIGASTCPSSSNRSQACVVELADYMYNNDLNADLEGTQVVRSHMVGFDFDEQWLEDIANAGGGTYATANDLESLLTEFKTIIAEVLKTDTSFVAPVAAINQFNRLTNRDEVYFAVFKPDGVPAWLGNLKRYRLGSVNGQSNVLLDANDNTAVDPDTGFFRGSARSYWSSVADGGDVEKGGAAENLPAYASRNVFTDLTSAPTSLTASNNALTDSNSEITEALLGVAGSTERTELIDWIRGKDVDDADGDGTVSEDRMAIGDPLHSRPVAINYGLDENEQAQVVLFFGTNAGNLHAIDATNGTELFTYIPRELLELQADLRLNSGSNSHFYGLDGSPSAWIKNTGSSEISSAEGDHVYLYIGQRRGGQNYYALDVTDTANPRLMWKLQPSNAGFEALGYSWARPVVGRLNIGGVARDVIYLAGGYDEANDDETTRNTTADEMGNALYIVDAIDGSLIWSAGLGDGYTESMSDMLHAIPAAPAVFDVDSDGFDDGLFVGDTGGQVWRFDFSQGQSVDNLATGGVIARLGAGGATDASANRRFYHAPDVALADVAGVTKLVVTIGSGARPNPLSEVVNDRFYAIFQNEVFNAPSVYTVLNEGDDPATDGVIETSDFYDATLNLLQSTDGATVQAEAEQLAGKSGWYMGFPRTGEKVLSTPLSFRGGVSFTTYEPRNESDSCTPKAGTSRLYLVSLTDGTLPEEQNSLTPPVVDGPPDRFTELNTPSIVDEPVIICTDQGCELFAGPEQPPIPLLEGDNIVRTHWRQD